ncbi:hypothetical protein LPJ59_001781 [Coemansia sp. RSA 2399]|nr:hypothetical protein LPJ59_001781 [Coemansia sp. RSA 2399]
MAPWNEVVSDILGYYFLADAVLLTQIHYYNYLRRRQARLGSSDEAEPMLAGGRTDEDRDNAAINRTSGSSQRLNSSIFLPVIALLVLGSIGKSINGSPQPLPSTFVEITQSQVPRKPKLVPQILGYLSALLFLGARIPQLIKNYKKRSCDGLSIGMFIFSILGNVAFTLSLLLHSLDSDYLLANIPWIVGSTGTLFFDLGIFYQFYIYHEMRHDDTREPE